MTNKIRVFIFFCFFGCRIVLCRRLVLFLPTAPKTQGQPVPCPQKWVPLSPKPRIKTSISRGYHMPNKAIYTRKTIHCLNHELWSSNHVRTREFCMFRKYILIAPWLE